MQTYLELTPVSGRGGITRILVDKISRVFVEGRKPKEDHSIIIDRSGLMVAWFDDAAFLPAPSRVNSARTYHDETFSAVGRYAKSINLNVGDIAVFVPVGEGHPFVFNRRKYNRLEVVVK